MSKRHSSEVALQTATVLRDLMRRLFTLSIRQMEMLDREDYGALEQTLTEKATLLNVLPAALEAGSRLGWKLHDPATYPTEAESAKRVCEAADLSRRLQAHERFSLSQALARRSLMDERMSALFSRRHAASGYAVPRTHGGLLDTAR
jgi:hypothetical protein